MDRARFSFLAHASHDVCNPIASAKVDHAIALVALAPAATFLDIGAGKGEVARRLAEHAGCLGTAIEHAPLMAAACRERVRTLRRGAVEVIEADAATIVPAMPAASFDAAICLGSTHALGGFDDTIAAAHRVLRPGGWLLIADGYWKREPAPEYLAALGTTAGEHTTHAENVARVARAGFVPRWAWTASEDEWDQYEWRYAWNIEQFCDANPHDPDGRAMRERSRAWRDIVLTWGRETLGFGMILARKA